MRRTGRATAALLLASMLLAAPVAGWGQSAGERPSVRCRLAPELEMLRFRPGREGRIAIRASNATDRPVDARATVYFKRDPNLQYVRRLWIPARAERTERCPIQVPETEPSTVNREVGLLFEEIPARAGGINPVGAEAGAKARLVPVYHESLATGLIFDLQEDSPWEAPCFRALRAAQASRGASRRVSVLEKQPLLLDPSALDALDFLLLTSDRIASDPGSLTAVRDWILGGGCLWIMLDEVAPDTVSLLLGDAFSCQTVDRIWLTRVSMRNKRTGAPYPAEQAREFEAPVPLIRVLTSDATVIDEVAGWPASFWMPFGRGRVLFTTLGAEAWIRPRRPEDPLPDRAFGELPDAATTPLAGLAGAFLAPRTPSPLDRSQWTAFLSHQIGYRILDRATAAAVLGAFCLIVLAAGLWWARVGRLERLAWMGPVAAALAAAALIALGERSRQRVPATAAVAQWAVTAPGVDGAHVSGLVALYNPRESSGRLGSQGSGVFTPDRQGLEGVVRRIVWTDERAWHWENLALPAGVRAAPLRASAVFDDPVSVRCVFGPNGLTGAVAPGPFENLEDAMISAPGRPSLAVRLGPGGTLAAGPDDLLAKGQYFAEALLSDRQQQRRAVYQALLSQGAGGSSAGDATFFAWADALDLGLQFPDQRRTIGSVLMEAPLRIERPAPDALVRVPPTFLPYRSTPGPEGRMSSPYSNRTGQWVEVQKAGWSWLRFEPPAALTPLSLQEATLTIDIQAASRALEIHALTNGRKRVLARRESPMGVIRLELDLAEPLETDSEGGITLGVFVGPQSSVSQSNGVELPWKIDSVRLEILGRTR